MDLLEVRVNLRLKLLGLRRHWIQFDTSFLLLLSESFSFRSDFFINLLKGFILLFFHLCQLL